MKLAILAQRWLRALFVRKRLALRGLKHDLLGPMGVRPTLNQPMAITLSDNDQNDFGPTPFVNVLPPIMST